MNKILVLMPIVFLMGCADYLAERDRQRLNRERLSQELQIKNDKKTCEYYGFKEKTLEFSNCLMQIDIARKENIKTRKMLECEAVRRDNAKLAVSGFWAGVLMQARENLACD